MPVRSRIRTGRARAVDDAGAARLAGAASRFDEEVRYFEAILAEECPPPAEDFGCRVSEAQNHPQLNDHDVIGFGLCKRTIDRVDGRTSAPFRRIDMQAVVLNTSTRTFRSVPIASSSDRAFSVAILPPMQPTEGLQFAVQGLPAGARVEFTPFGEGIRGQVTSIPIP